MRFRAFGIAHCGAQILRYNNALRASACAQMKSKSRKLCKLEGSFLRRFFNFADIICRLQRIIFYARELPKTLQKSPFFLRIFKKIAGQRPAVCLRNCFDFFWAGTEICSHRKFCALEELFRFCCNIQKFSLAAYF